MLRKSLSFLLLAGAAFAQNAPPAPADTLQSLLNEVHQLRLDLQATTVTAQRVQILLYRVQLQQAATARAASRADDAHSRLSDAQKQTAAATQAIRSLQEQAARTVDPNLAKNLESMLAEQKKRLEAWQPDEQQWQAREIDAQSQLRVEQAKLGELQDTLDRLDKALAKMASQ
jgi:chromosome segregation ATPase